MEEDQLVNGTGTAPALRGILATPGISLAFAKVATESAADAVLEQAMRVQTASRLAVDGVILAPSAFKAITTAKADTAGSYLSGQPLAAAPLLSIWGIRYCVSPVLAAGTALVGSFRRAAAIHRKGSVRLDMSNSHADYFIKNLVAVRCEIRELLAVYWPSGFGLVTGLS